MSSKMGQNRYSNLISNTLLFAISGFGSKILSLILTPLVTRNMVPDDFGTAIYIVNICNVILPLMYLCISEAVIRYGMEEGIKKSDIYTSSISIVLIGYGLVGLMFPLLKTIPNIGEHLPLVYLFLIASAMRTVTTHFIRCLGEVRLFAVDGIFTSVLNLSFIILFLIVMDMGIVGYLLATILPDIISTLFLTIKAKAWHFFSLPSLDKSVTKKMLQYSVPLVPAAVSWWITTSSNKIILAGYIDKTATGIFEGANRVPQLLILVSTIFIQAWQMSAFSESNHNESKKFFSQVFTSYSALVFLAGSGLILLIKPFTNILLGPAYQSAWQYSPILILSVVLSCLVTFLGTIYNFNKKNLMVTLTTILGAIITIILNIILIPRIGMQGAALATLLGYFIVFLVRAIDTRRLMKINIQPVKFAINLLLLLAQILICVNELKFGYVFQVGILFLVIMNNGKPLLFILRQAMGTLYKLNNK